MMRCERKTDGDILKLLEFVSLGSKCNFYHIIPIIYTRQEEYSHSWALKLG